MIMEKKEAIKILKDFHDESALFSIRTALETLYPEFKESEGEKTRKEIVDYLKKNLRFEWAVWLEKQGEKPIIEMKSPEESLGISSKKYNDIVNDCLYGESKSTDNTEPKFKVGDWVIDKQGIVHQIANVIENVTNHTYGYDIVGGGYFNDNSDVRLWTIKDAKDGDILVCGKEKRPFIFKGLLDKFHPNNPVVYCGINCGNEFCIPVGISWWTDEEIEPATKEQCDLLFQKMKEAGYEWDADKKELKLLITNGGDFESENCEQKPTQEIEPFEAEHGKYYYCIKDYFCGGRKQASKGDVVQALRGLPIMGLKDASEYFLPVNSIKCNSAWSEEDEVKINRIVACLENLNVADNDILLKDVDWLKSLRPQSQWKPSDEQIEILDMVLTNESMDDNIARILRELREQLKKLREE